MIKIDNYPAEKPYLSIETPERNTQLDNKVYFYVGRVLQGIAVSGAIASIAAYSFTAIILSTLVISTIAAVTLFVIGTIFTNASLPLPEEERPRNVLRPARVFVEGQPVGIVNRSNNCWAISMMQLILHTPSLCEEIENGEGFRDDQFQPLRDFIAAYRASCGNQEFVSAEAKAQNIRECLHVLNNHFSRNGRRQEDAGEAILQILGRLPNGRSVSNQILETRSNGGRQERFDSIICLDLPGHRNAPFEELFPLAFQGSANDLVSGAEITSRMIFRDGAPNEMMVQINRFTNQVTPRGGFRSVKLNEAVAIPDVFDLPDDVLPDGAEEASYECDGFIEHRGASSQYGHYVTYVKKEGIWWRCNDETVTAVPEEIVKRAKGKGYIYHFSKVEK